MCRYIFGTEQERALIKFASWSLLAAVMLTLPCDAAAQGFIIPEIGARKNGMGASIGRVDELTAIYHNPAALAGLHGTRVGTSMTLAFLQTDVRLGRWPGSDTVLEEPIDVQGYYPRQRPSVVAPIPFIGGSTSLLSDKLVLALAVYVPNAAGAEFGANEPTRYHIIDAFLFSAFFTAAAAYQPLPWLSVGAGISAAYIRISRRSLLFPVITQPDGREVDLTSFVGTKTRLDLQGSDLKPVFSFGLQVWPHETLSLGFMMLSRYDVALEGDLKFELDKDSSLALLGDPTILDSRHRTEVVAPWIFGFGANWDITPWLEVGAEVRLYLMSLVDQQVTRITSEGLLQQQLPDGLVTPKNLHNSVHVAGGFKIVPPLPLDIDLMTGVHYENSSSPDNTVEVSAPTFDLIALHFGARWRFAKRYSLALLYSRYQYLERTTTDSITNPPTNFVGSAYNNQLSLVIEARFSDGIAAR